MSSHTPIQGSEQPQQRSLYARSSGESQRQPLLGKSSWDHGPRSTPRKDHDGSDADDDENHEGDESNEDDENSFEENDSILEDEDGEDEQNFLPLFEESKLDSLPIYQLTHTIRLMVIPRCETTLTWDQLRSPQVSQFMVKPLQQDLRNNHFSKAIIFALLANCVQFQKEVEFNPGSAGACRTRSMLCELLAIRLLKEFSTRDLIDALSYDFNPLQGQVSQSPENPTAKVESARQIARVARISTLEMAIRASSKRFLAHPLVVQQLEAIWAGLIVFHSAADHVHRIPINNTQPPPSKSYGTLDPPRGRTFSRAQITKGRVQSFLKSARRTVSIYNPKDASLFKLSRLRVPRYRQFFSTCSLAILLALYITTLNARATEIRAEEIVFWIWSFGFMLDELVGFSDQGYSLYIMSFWNAFDIGILGIFVVYYGLRLYSIVLDDARQHSMAALAYDVLAANAILLFPRLFSALDHYRYFSQLLIAFRMMAVDLVALMLLLLISGSGFLIALTLAFGNDSSQFGQIAYKLFQIVLGFTPAAWEVWNDYNVIGKFLLGAFLVICHFLIVTILITVLTNSFMAIAQNANDEHQFVFAVNTISMVKSEALFSYVAPANLLGWLLVPLQYIMSFRFYVVLNRTVIKASHFPILFTICIYEKLFLRSSSYAPLNLTDERPNPRKHQMFNSLGRLSLFSPQQGRLRETSLVTSRKDRALDEVFRRPFRGKPLTSGMSQDRGGRNSSNVINAWLQNADQNDEGASEPQHHVVPRLSFSKAIEKHGTVRRQGSKFLALSRSANSDPEISVPEFPFPQRIANENQPVTSIAEVIATAEISHRDHQTGEAAKPSDLPQTSKQVQTGVTPTKKTEADDVMGRPELGSRQSSISIVEPDDSRFDESSQTAFPTISKRIPSSATMVHISSLQNTSSAHVDAPRDPVVDSLRLKPPSEDSPGSSQITRKAPRRAITTARSKPVLPSRGFYYSTPNIPKLGAARPKDKTSRSRAFQFDLASDLGDNKAVVGNYRGSYAPSMSIIREPGRRGSRLAGNKRGASSDNQDKLSERSTQLSEDEMNDGIRVSKLVLARMNTLEEGFREMMQEVRGLRRQSLETERPRSTEGGIEISSNERQG